MTWSCEKRIQSHPLLLPLDIHGIYTAVVWIVGARVGVWSVSGVLGLPVPRDGRFRRTWSDAGEGDWLLVVRRGVKGLLEHRQHRRHCNHKHRRNNNTDATKLNAKPNTDCRKKPVFNTAGWTATPSPGWTASESKPKERLLSRRTSDHTLILLWWRSTQSKTNYTIHRYWSAPLGPQKQGRKGKKMPPHQKNLQRQGKPADSRDMWSALTVLLLKSQTIPSQDLESNRDLKDSVVSWRRVFLSNIHTERTKRKIKFRDFSEVKTSLEAGYCLETI